MPTRSPRVVVAILLIAAAVIGFATGTLLGQPGQRAPTTEAVVSPTAPASPTITASPTTGSSPTTPLETTPSPTATASPRLILEMEGSGDEVGPPFDAGSGFEIEWETTGTTFRIAMTGDQDLGTIVDRDGAASGAISVEVTGTFRLEVTAEGPWSIIVRGNG